MASCIGLLQGRWRVWWPPCRQCSGRACGAVVFWVSWISNSQTLQKQLLSCVDAAWWEAAGHGQISQQTASFTNAAFGQLCSSHGRWQDRSTGGGWAVPCLLDPCRRGGRNEMLLLASGAPQPPGCSVWGVLWAGLPTCSSCSGTFHLASYADHFWRDSTGLGGLFASPCS